MSQEKIIKLRFNKKITPNILTLLSDNYNLTVIELLILTLEDIPAEKIEEFINLANANIIVLEDLLQFINAFEVAEYTIYERIINYLHSFNYFHENIDKCMYFMGEVLERYSHEDDNDLKSYYMDIVINLSKKLESDKTMKLKER